ncbi:MAG: hypothetical protein QM640_10645 [Niabella sp.]
MMNRRRCGPPKFVFIFFALAAVFVFGAIVMLLWNAILPPVLHVNTISYWQAVGILVLCKILFGGFRGGPGREKFERMQNFREKIKNMSPEERERFKEEWKRRCGR